MIVSLLISSVVIAQQVPQGMKYQAVARNLKGEIMANEKISLRISLNSMKKGTSFSHYSERHTLVTNEVGLFTLVIGEGKGESIKFSEIPWSTEDIWMQVSIAEKGKSGFTDISYSKLMTVPYAFHAGTASRLSGSNLIENKTGTDNPSPSSGNSWKTSGNRSTNPATDFIGTVDNADLIFKSNGIERLRITAAGKLITPAGTGLELGGNLQVKGDSVKMDKDLYVGRNVVLNYLPWDLTPGTTPSGTPIPGNTINRGNFTVSDMSSTLLTGSLTVDKLVRFNDATSSTTPATGALKVTGGVGIGENLNVNNNITSKSLKVIDNTPNFLATFENSNDATGDGIKIKLGKTHPAWNGISYANVTNVGAEMFQAPINTIRGWILDHVPFNPSQLITLFPASLIAGSTCNLLNIVIDKINDAIPLPLVTQDVNTPAVVLPALSVSLGELGSFDIIGQTTLLSAQTILPSFTLIPELPNINCGSLPSFTVPVIHFTNVNNSLTNANQFISFTDKDNKELGSIRAQSVNDWSANYLNGSYFVNLMAGLVGIDLLNGIANAVAGFTDLADSYNKIGVEYASGHADYAEWLERIDPKEMISPGDIVGVKGGKVSKNLDGAEQILAVSHNPIILGNAQSKEREPFGNKIAFTGQVPVKVMGPVNMGDYIIAKGGIAGYGIPVNPADITIEDLKFAVGRSWESNTKEGPKMVNTLIGIDNGEYIKIIKDNKSKIEELENRINLIESIMGKFISNKGNKKRN